MVNVSTDAIRQRANAKVEEIKSKSTSINAWKLPRSKSTYAPPGVDTNADLDPTPPWQRTWGFWTWAAYWFSDLLTASIWQKAAAIITLGLDWRQSLGIITLGSFILSVPMVLNGAMGAYLHVPFPIAVRTSFGYYFSLFAVVSRLVLSWFWFGINTWNGGSAMTGMIRAIWPSYSHLPNHLSAGSGITSQQLLSYFLFWLLQYPFLLIHPSKLRFLFVLKVIFVPAVMIATVAWISDKAGGSGALLRAHTKVEGEAFSHAWLFSLNSVIGGYSTVAVNIPDFSRYTKKPIWQWFQLVTLPFFYVLTGLFGIIAASCSYDVYGTYLWSPFAIIAKWDNRAAVFFASAAWAIAQISVNVTGNTISGANDLATLFPRWINIRRGSIICALLGGWCMVPWKILSTGKNFLTFMNGYTIFLGPFAAFMIADFWILRKWKVDVPALYNPHGRYRYWNGINWRAVVTLIVVVAPPFPGLIASINSKVDVGNAKWIFDIGWIWGFVLSLLIYTILSYVWPPTETFVDEAVLPVFPENEEYVDATESETSVTKEKDVESLKEKELEKERVMEASAPFAHGEQSHLDALNEKERDLA